MNSATFRVTLAVVLMPMAAQPRVADAQSPTTEDKATDAAQGILQVTRFIGLVGIADQGQGIDVFYNLAIKPAAQLTCALQVLDSILPNTDITTILGARLRLVF